MHKKFLIISLAVVSILFLSCFSFAEDFALPTPDGRVNDFAKVINPEYKDKLNLLINEVEEKTSSEIMVVTIGSIAPYDEAGYARLIFDNWKPGKKGKDNGVLILLAIKERRWRIEIGYGLESILSDGLCGEIGRDYMTPYFKQGKYGEGLYYGVAEIAKVIAKDAKVNLSSSKETNFKVFNKAATKFSLAIFAFGFFLIWNIPWPIFIGLPFTLLFASAFAQSSLWIGLFPIFGYLGAMIIRYFIWRGIPIDKRKSFWWFLIFGLFALAKTSSYRDGGFGGGFGGYTGGGGGGGGFGGGGGGGGGGAGGGF